MATQQKRTKSAEPRDWDTLALVLAKETCTSCAGGGKKRGAAKPHYSQPCHCVLRAVFRACYARFRQCQVKQHHVSTANLEAVSGGSKSRSLIWGRKDQEFSADFYLVSRRTLDAAEWCIFNYHYLLGAEWSACCSRLKIDRGTFFHAVYRIQQKLGRVFRELKPYGLYPLDEYFSGCFQQAS